MDRDRKRSEVVELRRSGCSLPEIVARTSVPLTTVHRWTKGVEPASSPRPPESAEPPAGVADRAGWLRTTLAYAEEQARRPGPAASAWARHALEVRNRLDETEADARKALEAAGKAAEPDPVTVARSILDVLPQLARQIPRAEALKIHAELGKVLGVVEEEG